MNPTTASAAPAAHRSKKRPPLQRVGGGVGGGGGGPVGSGKTTRGELRCKTLRDRWDGVVVTSDIQTKEDQRLLTVAGALDADRLMGVEAGAGPHSAIREDASIKLEVIDRRLEKFPAADSGFIESGADKLAATFSPELSELTICVIAVAAGEKIPQNSGPGSTKSDWFVINKTDLAPCVGADQALMEADTHRMRPDHAGRRPYAMTQLKTRDGLAEVLRLIERRGRLVET